MFKNRFNLFYKFFKFILPYRKKWVVILFLSAVSSLFSLVNPYLSRLFVDQVLLKKNFNLFPVLFLVGGAAFIALGLADSFKNFLNRQVNLKVKFDINRKVFGHMQSLPYSWFQQQATGEQLYKIGYDIDRAADFVTDIPPKAVLLFPKLVFIVLILLYINFKMAVFALCLTPFLWLPPYYYSRKMRKIWEKFICNCEDIFKRLEEVFSRILLVKAFGEEKSTLRSYIRKIISNYRLGLENVKIEVTEQFTVGFINKLALGLIIFYGAHQVMLARLSLGSLTAVIVYLGQLIMLHRQFTYFFQRIALGFVSCERLDRVLDYREPPSRLKRGPRDELSDGSIVFKNIDFGYRGGEYLLRSLNFSINSGSHIALVGSSGCGKTTILNLILQVYLPWQGRIFLGGYEAETLDLSFLRKDIGVALQEPFLWNDTIENNITYGSPDVSSADIARVAAITGVDRIVEGLAAGYRTVTGESACRLSEGQRQRIAIARALIKNPKILLFDEAFASIDSYSEKNIIANIKKEFKNTTIITVSHRLSAALNADLAYFLAGPDKIIVDKAQNLLKNNREFSLLFSDQAAEGIA